MTREELIWEKRIMSMKGSSLLVIKRRDITQFQVPIVSLQMPDEIVDEILENRKLISDLRKENEELRYLKQCYKNMQDDNEKLQQRIQELEKLPAISECDVCHCHPSVIIRTGFGTFCQTHAKYI